MIASRIVTDPGGARADRGAKTPVGTMIRDSLTTKFGVPEQQRALRPRAGRTEPRASGRLL
ncbi:MAG: hypothetical protein R3F61_34640 [Myxococcota bacterium]